MLNYGTEKYMITSIDDDKAVNKTQQYIMIKFSK